MATRKMTTVTVRATRQQAARWGGAAQHDGAASVGAWLSGLATERLRYLGRFVPRLALRWQRGRFNLMERPGAGVVADLQDPQESDLQIEGSPVIIIPRVARRVGVRGEALGRVGVGPGELGGILSREILIPRVARREGVRGRAPG
jgi:hypothetical protein